MALAKERESKTKAKVKEAGTAGISMTARRTLERARPKTRPKLFVAYVARRGALLEPWQQPRVAAVAGPE